jgi:FkbM family methyltransferase
MIKDLIRNLANKYGYNFVRTEYFNYGKKNFRQSNDPKTDYYETLTGNYYFPKNCSGDGVANAIKDDRIFEQPIVDIASTYIKKGTVALDIGANYGQMSVLFSKLVTETGLVYSFEAQKIVYDILSKNLVSNNCTNVKAFYNAVFDKDDITILFPDPDLEKLPTYGSYGIDPNAKSGKEVKSITIDSIEFDKPISFMKVDIQGCDLFALKGAVNTIKKHQMAIIFEYEEPFQEEFKTSFQDYVDFVDSIGYKFLKTVQEINFLIVPK